ncbi:MAG: hypothetical protein SP1CHLAM54_16360 [Chlamydiia bacterium]|nr:hypothetical protein [Chlamydiia bacterium]MCH9616525.1 hypothetical protein [Chlamydiia bacterium]
MLYFDRLKFSKWLLLILCSSLLAKGGSEPSPAEVHAQLVQAQSDLEIAKKMFNPYYAGPLFAMAPNNVPKGMRVIQPYFFVTSNYGVYTESRRMQSQPNEKQLQFLNLEQLGLTHWLDFTLLNPSFASWQSGEFGAGFGDVSLQLGFQLCTETPSRPVIRFVVGESFPAGRYNHLSPSKPGLMATGSGSYETQLVIAMGKIFWANKLHPLSTRWTASYLIPSKVYVKQINAYGGGTGTKGKVNPGQQLSIDIGTELSITQHWVFANDVVYTYNGSTSFKGDPGLAPSGAAATVGGPSNDSLMLAPAIEYNPNDMSGLIMGGYFTVTGRNSAASLQLVISYYAAF